MCGFLSVSLLSYVTGVSVMKHKTSKLQEHLREYVNPAFVVDETQGTSAATSGAQDRKNSLAEIVATLESTFGRNKKKYVHPFGSHSKFEEMVYGLEEAPSPYSGTSPGKLLPWVIFVGFFVCMAAGVIYLAETYNRKNAAALESEAFSLAENVTKGGIG